MRLPLHAVVIATLSLAASPALAHDGPHGDSEARPYGYDRDYDGRGYDPREAWLADFSIYPLN